MTELEWLKQESGMDDKELAAMEAVAGRAKFIGMLQKIIGTNEAAIQAKADAEAQTVEGRRQYNEEFVPEMRKVTQDALAAQARAAAAEAALKSAREYGIVPPETNPNPAEPPRAPGSPNPDSMTRAEFDNFRGAQSRTIIAVNDLNADHFKLFGSPLPDTQGLVDEVTRQHVLGNKAFTLKQAWETKHNVPAKREEITKAERQKEIDTAIAADRKTRAEASGPNGNLRSGQPSRFSTYKPSDSGKEPWKAPHSINERNRPWREKAISKVREAMAS